MDKNVSATSSTAVNTESYGNLSLEQMDAILMANKEKIAAIQAQLGNDLKNKFAECIIIKDRLKAINPQFRVPWEIFYTRKILSYAIRDYLRRGGGSARGTDIIAQFTPLCTEMEIKQVLNERSLNNKYRLWDYKESEDMCRIVKVYPLLQ